MKARVFLFLLIIVSAAVFGAIGESSDPEQIIEALRRQMKELDTLRADYTVDTTTYPSNKVIQYKVSYVKSGDKFNMSEYAYDGAEQIGETRTVYDEIDIKVWNHTKKENRNVGAVHNKNMHDVLITRNDIRNLITGFGLIRRQFEENLGNLVFRNLGTELLDGHKCIKIVMISPYKPPQKAYNYMWIETRNEKYYLMKYACYIEDDPNQLLYEKRYSYNYSDVYPCPRKIYYERFEIDNEGNRTPYYKLDAAIENFEVNVPVADSEFIYFFPEGTLIDTTSASIDIEKITDPNWPNLVNPPKNAAEVNQPARDDRTEFPIGGGCGAIVIPVNIYSREYLFVIDTGSSHTAFDSSLRDILGKPKRIVRAGSPAHPMVIQTFESPTIGIGSFSLPKGNEIACLDLSTASMADGRQISGIIGMDFLRNHVIQIDLDKGCFSFLEDDDIDSSSFGQKFDFVYNSLGLPQIKGRILGRIDIDFVIDCGNISTGDLDHETFEKLMEQKEVKTAETMASTAAGIQKSREMRISNLTIGPFEYKDLIFAESNGNILGLEFLSRHIATLDFPNRVMYLKKGKQFDKNDESGMSGLAVLRMSGQLVVHSIGQESPAEKAGFLAGDIILKIEGKEADNFDMGRLKQLFRSGHGRKITLTIERNGETKEMALVLEKKI
ncbi:MAG: aspartyl protease family protein [Sedimentisphaerales bacterium]|nr:aspartyl protease family protein [Sedimentisphaerales bacterium]